MPAIPSHALKTLEVVSTSKQKLYICNQKELKLLVTKNPDSSSFRKKLRKLFLEKKYKVMLHLAVTFQQCQIYFEYNKLFEK